MPIFQLKYLPQMICKDFLTVLNRINDKMVVISYFGNRINHSQKQNCIFFLIENQTFFKEKSQGPSKNN